MKYISATKPLGMWDVARTHTHTHTCALAHTHTRTAECERLYNAMEMKSETNVYLIPCELRSCLVTKCGYRMCNQKAPHAKLTAEDSPGLPRAK